MKDKGVIVTTRSGKWSWHDMITNLRSSGMRMHMQTITLAGIAYLIFKSEVYGFIG